jgi:hypothetical protein
MEGVFQVRELRKIFGPKVGEVTGRWRECILRSYIICTIYQVFLGCSNEGE